MKPMVANPVARAAARLGLATALMLPGCSGPDEVTVDKAWVRLPAVPGRPAAGYAIVHGANRPMTLLRVSADTAIRTEMHETMRNGRMTSMRPLDSLPLPVKGEIDFEPGGRHLMLFGINPIVKPGGEMILTFNFGDGTRVSRKAMVVAAGDGGAEQ
ncbi:copper chaperone PCu(A)C [Sphingomonas abaci]|uniref:Copper chaperone PCu(A)C n=1 Tax=Sphingomonas abaci TaxID=237611 RepID=A0A7W7AK88_9SPHN|nr:copper chaperone PCu(A)C [Sphingomonas abaci]MBB4617592.1 hypothetical protein [Sphingomonas abaci]